MPGPGKGAHHYRSLQTGWPSVPECRDAFRRRTLRGLLVRVSMLLLVAALAAPCPVAPMARRQRGA
jgi:hypothetical protein